MWRVPAGTITGSSPRCARHPNRLLAANNQAVYALLRHGVPVQAEAGQRNARVQLIDWTDADKNHFAFAEEVTLSGGHERRPDIVLRATTRPTWRVCSGNCATTPTRAR